MSGQLVALISPPRAGKSTFGKQWLKQSDEDGLNRIVLCRDVFRLAYYGERFNASKEAEMHERFDVTLKALHSTGDYKILLDETHTTVKAIRNVLRLDVWAEFIFINTPYEVCIERAYATEQPDLAEKGIIQRMFDNLITLCNYRVAECAKINKYDGIREDYIYEAVRKIRDEVLEEKDAISSN